MPHAHLPLAIRRLKRDIRQAFEIQNTLEDSASHIFVDFSEVRAFVALDDRDAAYFNPLKVALGSDNVNDLERAIQHSVLSRLFNKKPILLPPHREELSGFIGWLEDTNKAQEYLPEQLRSQAKDAVSKAAAGKDHTRMEAQQIIKLASEFIWLLNNDWLDPPADRLRQLITEQQLTSFFRTIGDQNLSPPNRRWIETCRKHICELRSGENRFAALRDALALDLLARLHECTTDVRGVFVTRSETLLSALDRMPQRPSLDSRVAHIRAFAMYATALEAGLIQHAEELKSFIKHIETNLPSAVIDEPNHTSQKKSLPQGFRTKWANLFNLASVFREFKASQNPKTKPQMKSDDGLQLAQNVLETNLDILEESIDEYHSL